jgi:hypothetical protein
MPPIQRGQDSAMSAIAYRKGMTLRDFRALMERRESTCRHPFNNVARTTRAVRAKVRPGIVFIVEYTCGDCGEKLGRDAKRIAS